MKNSLAILDIGSSSIVALIGQNGVNGTFNILGKGEISYAGFQNADFLEPENLKFVVATAISNAEISSGEKINNIIIGVPGEFCSVVVKDYSHSFVKPRKLNKNDVQFLYSQSIKNDNEPIYEVINKSTIYFDLDDTKRVINPVGMKCKNISCKFSFIYALKFFIKTITSIFEDLNINIAGFVCSPLAESLYLFEPEVRDKYAIMVDVGYITTNVAVARGNALLFLNSFSLGGGFITADLAQCLKIQFNEAERLKHKVLLNWKTTTGDVYNLEGDNLMQTYSANATNEIVSYRIEMICDYIIKCLDNCEYDLPDFLPIYVTGGGLNYIKGVRSILSKKLKRNIELVEPKLLNMNRPDYSSEVGLLDLALNNSNFLYLLLN